MTRTNLGRLLLLFTSLAVVPALADAPPPGARKAGAGAQPPGAATAAPSAAAQLGKPAPDFRLTDTDGKVYHLRELKGKTVVLEWFNPECPFVKYAHGKGPLVDLAKKVESPSVVWLSVNSGAPGKQGHGKDTNVSAKQTFGITNPVLLDEAGVVGKAYGALKTPHLFVIDAKGVLVYRGGLDNAPMGVPDDTRPRPLGAKTGELVAYLANALAELKQKQAIALADTPAYGCSVKYND